jgi:hypothetical protein
MIFENRDKEGEGAYGLSRDGYVKETNPAVYCQSKYRRPSLVIYLT